MTRIFIFYSIEFEKSIVNFLTEHSIDFKVLLSFAKQTNQWQCTSFLQFWIVSNSIRTHYRNKHTQLSTVHRHNGYFIEHESLGFFICNVQCNTHLLEKSKNTIKSKYVARNFHFQVPSFKDWIEPKNYLFWFSSKREFGGMNRHKAIPCFSQMYSNSWVVLHLASVFDGAFFSFVLFHSIAIVIQ